MTSSSERSGGRGRVLVVEDMAVVAMDIASTLGQLGYEVVGTVATGEEAIQVAATARPDLVLMDINLAGQVDGIEAAHQIRDSFQIPVVFLTAYSDEDTLQRAKLSDPFGYVVKPINKRELQANIHLALYRSQIDRALRESEERYAAVVRQSGEGIFLADVDGRRILEANPALQRLLGYTEAEFEALTLYDLLPYDREAIDQGIETVRTQRYLAPFAARHRCKDGSLLPVELSASVISYGGSEAVCVLVRDTRERQAAELAPKAAEEELETQRVLSVRADRLRCLGELAAATANELSQPLARLREQAVQVRDGIGQGAIPATTLVAQLNRIAEVADLIYHQVEHLQRFSAAVDHPDLIPVQVDEVVGQTVAMVQAQFRRQEIAVQSSLAGDLPPILANPFSLEEVVLNLLTNARDALRDQGRSSAGRITVSTAASGTGDEEQVQLVVEDNGPGIAGEVLARVFTPFFTTKGSSGGTGLGLPIARAIVEGFGGRLELRSAPGAGTTATVLLPVGRAGRPRSR